MWRVAQIPGRARAVIHDAIIALGVGDQPRILHRVQETLAVMLGIGTDACSSRSVSTATTSGSQVPIGCRSAPHGRRSPDRDCHGVRQP